MAPRRARRARRRRRRPADRPRDAPGGGSARGLAAERLHERFDLPDRARRRPRARRPEPVRPRLPRHGPAAVVRDGATADRSWRGGALALRLLPRHRDRGGRVARVAVAARRLPVSRPALHGRAAPRGSRRPRPVRGARRRRRRARREPGRRARTVVRDGGRAEPPPPRARVRVRCPRTRRVGRREPGRRAPPQAVRARRGAVPRARAAPARDAPPRGRRVRGRRRRRASCRSSSPAPARSGGTRSRTGRARIESSATASRGSCRGGRRRAPRELPVLVAGAARVGAGDGVSPVDATSARAGVARGGGGRVRALALPAPVARPRLPELVLRVAAHGGGARRLLGARAVVDARTEDDGAATRVR